MIEHITLGIIQGLAEWLPISSEGMIALVKILIFGDQSSLTAMAQDILFLHLGSALAVIVYLRKDIAILISGCLNWRNSQASTRKTIIFLGISTFISMGLGGVFLIVVSETTPLLFSVYRPVLIVIGACLIITAILQLKSHNRGTRAMDGLTIPDSLWLGFAQGCAALPGLSRSGLTIAALLLRNFQAETAVKLSFLMSIPIIVIGNVILAGLKGWDMSIERLVGLAVSFLVSLLTINILIRFAKKINFGKFLLIIAFLVLAAAFLPSGH